MIRSTPDGVEITVHVIPRAGTSALAGSRDGALLVRLAAPPVEGAANAELLRFLAGLLDLPRRAVRIAYGQRSRRKRVIVEGLTPDDVRVKLERATR